jgi:diguanylate cyclase (GGDEF)-like protein/PAS domain S-box-containing protein
VILFTSDTSESLLHDAARAGVTEVFLKVNVGELINFVGRYTARVRKIDGRVLYVEDNAAQAAVVNEQLASLGLTVEWCGSGEDAWTAFQKRDYDLVLTDIVLAGAMSGATVVSRIRSLPDERGDTPVIAITAFDQLARRIELFHLGVSDYVAKPIVEEELASRVRNLIGRRYAERTIRRREKHRFDQTLLRLSRTLNAAGGDLSATLTEICRSCAEVLEVSRVSVWLLTADNGGLICRTMHDQRAPGTELRATIARVDYPNYFEALLSERVIAARDALVHPATRELGGAYLIPNNIRAMLDVPLGPAGSRIGALCHELIGATRNWTAEEESFAAAAGDLVALAIESHQRWLADQQLRLAGLVFEAAAEAILICDRENRIVTANGTFSAMTGYSQEEVIGKTPAILKSGRHNEAFYADMWRTIVAEGRWHGEIWDRRKDGTEYLKRLSITRVLDDTGSPTHYIAVFTDITQEKEDQEKLRYLAYNDVLTELPNRVYAETTLSRVLDQAASGTRGTALLCFELDRFKKINSSFGHASGDVLLREVARRLRSALHGDFHLARWSGASFIAILGPEADAEAAISVAQHCIDAFRRPVLAGESELHVTLSIGIALHPQHGLAPADLIKNAMTALGHAKESGGNRFVFFDADMEKRTVARLLLESRLRRAIEQRQFVLHYQPKVAAASLAVVGMEALVRWQDPIEGLIPPAAFLGLAEETGQIFSINDWVLHEACRQTAAWRGASGLNLPVAVNLPAGTFSRGDLVSEIRRVLVDTGLPPALLELELTESAMVDDPQRAIEVFGELKALGVSIAIDDFGTGYSSLAHLRRFPIDVLKIDRSFVTNLGASDDELVIVSSIIGLAKSLRLKTVAEGIERESQATILRDLGCDQLQGYLFGRPLAPVDFLDRATKGRGRSVAA